LRKAQPEVTSRSGKLKKIVSGPKVYASDTALKMNIHHRAFRHFAVTDLARESLDKFINLSDPVPQMIFFQVLTTPSVLPAGPQGPLQSEG